jgi:hypothetical protein
MSGERNCGDQFECSSEVRGVQQRKLQDSKDAVSNPANTPMPGVAPVEVATDTCPRLENLGPAMQAPQQLLNPLPGNPFSPTVFQTTQAGLFVVAVCSRSKDPFHEKDSSVAN